MLQVSGECRDSVTGQRSPRLLRMAQGAWTPNTLRDDTALRSKERRNEEILVSFVDCIADFLYFCGMIEHLFTSMPMYVCGICTIFVAFRTEALAWLTAFMVTTTVLYAGHYLYFNRTVAVAPVADTAYCLCNLLVYPLYFIYLSRVAVGAPLHKKLKRPWMLLLPSVAVAAGIGALYCAMSATEWQAFVTQWLYCGQWSGLGGLGMAQAVAHVVAKVLFAVQIVPVLIVGTRMIKQHDQFVVDNYADIDGKTLASLHTLLIVLLATSVASFVANVVGRQIFVDSVWLLAIPSVAFSALLFAVAYVGLRLNPVIVNDSLHEEAYTPAPVAPEAPAASVGTTAEPEPGETQVEEEPKNKIAELKDEIVKLLNDEQLFLKHDLRIGDLSERLHTNRYYIQQAINAELGCTFSDLVNRLRIEHAVALMRANPAMPVAEVAERSGYRSPASFYRNFKLIKGCAPKDLKEDAARGAQDSEPGESGVAP